MNDRLSKSENGILEYLNSFSGRMDSISRTTTKEVLATKFKLNSFEISDYLNRLLDLNFIESRNAYDTGLVYYQITTFGKDYLEFKTSDHKNKIIWSILVPIGVSVVTSIILKIILG